MLSEKPWKSEATLRLLLGLLLCHLLGMIAMGAVRHNQGAGSAPVGVFWALALGCVAACGGALYCLREPWQVERFTRQFAAFLGGLYLALTFAWFALHFAGKPTGENPALRVLVAALSFQGAALVLLQRYTREHQVGWRDAFGFSVNWPYAVLLGGLAACSFLPCALLLQIASGKIMTQFSVKPETQPAIEALGATVTWLDRATIGIAAVGLAPVAEELLFRGVLYPAVKRAGFPRLALWGTSVVFAAIHWNLPTFLPLLLLALGLVWLYERTGNLLAPIAAHATFNACNFALFYVLPWAADHWPVFRNLFAPA